MTRYTQYFKVCLLHALKFILQYTFWCDHTPSFSQSYLVQEVLLNVDCTMTLLPVLIISYFLIFVCLFVFPCYQSQSFRRCVGELAFHYLHCLLVNQTDI